MQDFLGHPLELDDVIVQAERFGNVAELRLGRVRGFGVRDGVDIVKVEWLGKPIKNGYFEARNARRVIKVNELLK